MKVSNKLRIVSKLGEGTFSEVYKAKDESHHRLVAVKFLKKKYRTYDEVNSLSEVVVLKQLRGHPNIITLHDVFLDRKTYHPAMIFELMSMNLYEFLRENKGPLDEETTLVLIFQLLKALEFTHSHGLFHRDVKPENCMVDGDTFELKLCDFGSTRNDSGEGPFTEYVSTRWYRAPECILTSGSYGKSVDIWAVGCIMYELLSGTPLFPGKNELDQISKIHNICGSPSDQILAQFMENPNTQIAFQFPPRIPKPVSQFIPNVSSDACDLIHLLIEYDPRERITAQKALNHKVFQSYRDAEEKWKKASCPGPFPLFYARCEFGNPSSSGSEAPSAIHSPRSELPSSRTSQSPKIESPARKSLILHDKADFVPDKNDFPSPKGDIPISKSEISSSKSDHIFHENNMGNDINNLAYQKQPMPTQTLMMFNQTNAAPPNQFPSKTLYSKMGNSQRSNYSKKPFVLINEHLVESRKKAAIRVHEYKQKQKPSVSKHTQIHQSCFAPGPKFVKPAFH